MGKLRTQDDLKVLREELRSKNTVRGNEKDVIRIRVAMATCSIASGSKDTLNYIVDELEKRNIEASITQTGCMGYCYAEPTIVVSIPGKEDIMFGYVNAQKADEIIEKYIRHGELVEGIIPLNYKNIDETNN